MSEFEVPRHVTVLVAQADAIVEALDARCPGGRWAMTAFSRYRSLQLLEAVYEPYEGELDADPAVLFDQAASEVDLLDVPINRLGWRFALADALRSAAMDVRMVQDAYDV